MTTTSFWYGFVLVRALLWSFWCVASWQDPFPTPEFFCSWGLSSYCILTLKGAAYNKGPLALLHPFINHHLGEQETALTLPIMLSDVKDISQGSRTRGGKQTRSHKCHFPKQSGWKQCCREPSSLLTTSFMQACQHSLQSAICIRMTVSAHRFPMMPMHWASAAWFTILAEV